MYGRLDYFRCCLFGLFVIVPLAAQAIYYEPGWEYGSNERSGYSTLSAARDAWFNEVCANPDRAEITSTSEIPGGVEYTVNCHDNGGALDGTGQFWYLCDDLVRADDYGGSGPNAYTACPNYVALVPKGTVQDFDLPESMAQTEGLCYEDTWFTESGDTTVCLGGNCAMTFTSTGSSCTSPSFEPPAGSANSNPLTAAHDSVEYQYAQGGCGTVNGQRVCLGSASSSGDCVESGGQFTCLVAGDNAGVAPPIDQLTQDISNYHSQTYDWYGSGDISGTSTVSSGTIVQQGTGDGTAGGSGGLGSTDGAGTAGNGNETGPECAPGDLDCMGVNLEDGPALPIHEIDLATAINADTYNSPIGNTAACPQPYSVTLPPLFGSIVLDFSWQPFCDLAALMRPLVIAAGYIFGLLIIVRRLG